MLSRSLADPSPAVLRAALQLLRQLLQSTLALSAAPELARFTHRLLPALVARAAEEAARPRRRRGGGGGGWCESGDDEAAAGALGGALRWLSQMPTVGGARLAAAVLQLDCHKASEPARLGRLRVLQQLLRAAGTSHRAGTGGGDDPRPVPVGAAARWLCAAHGRSEPALREPTLQAALLLQTRAVAAGAATYRPLESILRARAPALLGAMRAAAPPPPAHLLLPSGAEDSPAQPGPQPGHSAAASPEEGLLRARLVAGKTREQELHAELVGLRTQAARRRREAAAAQAAAARGRPSSAQVGAEPTALEELLAALRVEATELVRARDKLETRISELREQRRRVRPKDLQTLERARTLERSQFLSSPQFEGVKQAHRAHEVAAA